MGLDSLSPKSITQGIDRRAVKVSIGRAVRAGKHAIGKKVLEEAGEVWMAAEYEGKEKTAEEISQLLYHLQVMMIACDLELEDIYKYL